MTRSLVLLATSLALVSRGVRAFNVSSIHATKPESASRHLADAPTCSVVSDVDFVGNDLGSVARAAATDCCAPCAQLAGCRAYSWSAFNGGTCWLKSGSDERVAATGVQSGVVTPGSDSGSDTCELAVGVDYLDHDIGDVPGASALECCAACSSWAGCGAFSWSGFNGGTCWLKSGRGQTAANAAVTSGRVTQSASCSSSVEENTDFIGNDIGSAPGASVSQCCSLCSQRAGCSAFTWSSYNGGTCWLKSSRGSTTTQSGVHSGVLSIQASPSPSPSPPSPLPPPSSPSARELRDKIRSGELAAKSVNLGGWLVGEYWMSFTSPAWKDTDGHGWEGEYGTMKYLGREKGIAQFEQHRATWITEADIKEIKTVGLNSVRVPVGFWIVNDDPSTTATSISSVYAPGALKYLDMLINTWAVKYKIAVQLSLHSHQGSQNGYDHSAPQELGKISWSDSQENVDNSLQFATFLAARYKDSDAFIGLTLMNEPSYPVDYNVLWDYYKEAYRRIRATGNDCIIGTSPMIQEQGPPVMMNFMRWPEYTNVWHEFHVYYKWGYEGKSEQQILDAASHYRASHLDNWSGNWIYMGEWSLASPDEAPFADRNQLKQFAQIQMQQFEGAHSGWAFWSWHHDDDTVKLSGWSLRQLIREGIITLLV